MTFYSERAPLRERARIEECAVGDVAPPDDKRAKLVIAREDPPRDVVDRADLGDHFGAEARERLQHRVVEPVDLDAAFLAQLTQRPRVVRVVIGVAARVLGGSDRLDEPAIARVEAIPDAPVDAERVRAARLVESPGSSSGAPPCGARSPCPSTARRTRSRRARPS
jgi:hypothetical protein